MSKKASVLDEPNSLIQDLTKEYGNVLVNGSSIIERQRQVIPFSPAADLSIGGGIQEGSTVIFSSQPKVGKTTAALRIAANAQKVPLIRDKKESKRHVFICNAEHRLQKRDLLAHDFDYDRLQIIESSETKILSAQDHLAIAEALLRNYPGCVLLMDSFSALSTAEEQSSEMDKMQRADGAKLIKKFMRRIAPILGVNNCILIGIVHLIGNPTGYGAEFKESGGQGIMYQADYRLRAIGNKFWTTGTDETGERIGQIVTWQVGASPLTKPGNTFESYHRYGIGIDECTEIAKVASDINVIEKSGAWYKLASVEGTPKFQGMEKLTAAIRADANLKEHLLVEIKKLVG